ncbi:UNVERIFIED_CONTAM: hypothetical protein I5919_15615 [Aeromonas hydrophila]
MNDAAHEAALLFVLTKNIFCQFPNFPDTTLFVSHSDRHFARRLVAP